MQNIKKLGIKLILICSFLTPAWAVDSVVTEDLTPPSPEGAIPANGIPPLSSIGAPTPAPSSSATPPSTPAPMPSQPYGAPPQPSAVSPSSMPSTGTAPSSVVPIPPPSATPPQQGAPTTKIIPMPPKPTAPSAFNNEEEPNDEIGPLTAY